MKITRKDNKIIIEIDYYSKRFNPYDEKGDYGKFKSLTGLIVRHRKDGNNYDEIGFANTIDRDYKGKCDDIGDFVIKWYGGEESFIKKCKELGLGIQEINF